MSAVNHQSVKPTCCYARDPADRSALILLKKSLTGYIGRNFGNNIPIFGK
jgi:hypothetical protein